MRRPGQRSTEYSVALAKIADYLLDDQHPVGGPKAAFFLSFGFRRSDPQVLARTLVSHALETPWTETPSPFGILLAHEGEMITPSGRRPIVRSVWLDPRDGGPVSLVTAYPR